MKKDLKAIGYSVVDYTQDNKYSIISRIFRFYVYKNIFRWKFPEKIFGGFFLYFLNSIFYIGINLSNQTTKFHDIFMMALKICSYNYSNKLIINN